MGGGGQQTDPTLAQIQQQQTYKDLGNTITQSFQTAGKTVAGANAGLSGQVAGVNQAPMVQPSPVQAPVMGAAGPLFAQPGMGGGGGINEQQLAQILRALGYGG